MKPYLIRAAEAVVDGWLVMILLGVLHSQDAAIPALGFWVSTLAAFVLSFVTASKDIL